MSDESHSITIASLRRRESAVAPEEKGVARRARTAHHTRAGQRFLKGPIDWNWLVRAAGLSRGASILKVTLLLWFLVGVRKSREVMISRSLMSSVGLDRHSYYRAVRSLASAKLVTLGETEPGRRLRVRVEDAIAGDVAVKEVIR